MAERGYTEEELEDLAELKAKIRAENEKKEDEAAEKQAEEFEAFLDEQAAIAGAKEAEAEEIKANYGAGGFDALKDHEKDKLVLGECVVCGNFVLGSQGFREDPRGSGKFFHMHGCFANRETNMDRARDRKYADAENFDPAANVDAKAALLAEGADEEPEFEEE